jgi:5'-3' exonuclease
MPEVRAPDGILVNAVVGFLNFIERLLNDRKPGLLYVAFEFGSDWRPQFRVTLLPEYKSARVATGDEPPDEVEPQLLIIAEMLKALGISIANATECEAEDVIATLTTKIEGPIEIVSGDRDLYTLVRDPRIRVLFTVKGVSELAAVDQAWITSKYGIPGDRYMDFAILRGDPSDGLPGVRGIGDKTASQLLAKYGSLDGILAATDLSPTIRAKLNASKDYVVAARTVVGPVLNCAIEVTGDGSIPKAPPEPMHVAALAQRYGVEASARRVVDALKA